jgi:hypothetical protein
MRNERTRNAFVDRRAPARETGFRPLQFAATGMPNPSSIALYRVPASADASARKPVILRAD